MRTPLGTVALEAGWGGKKEAEIMQYRFGLNGGRQLLLREPGNRFRLTTESIRQIEKRALLVLQNPGRNEPLRAYI